MAIFWCLLFGGVIGWLGSLLMRTDTSERILIDITVGTIGAIALARVLANTATFDILMAGYLGSVCGLALLYVIRRAPHWRTMGR